LRVDTTTPHAGTMAIKRYPWPQHGSGSMTTCRIKPHPDGSELEIARVRKWTAEAKRAEYELARTEGSMVWWPIWSGFWRTFPGVGGQLLSLPKKLPLVLRAAPPIPRLDISLDHLEAFFGGCRALSNHERSNRSLRAGTAGR
jgi:hypothetical protein